MNNRWGFHLPLPRWALVFLYLLVLFPLLGCFSINYFIDMDQDGNGAGTIHMMLRGPGEFAEKGLPKPGSDPFKLAEEGWKDIRWSMDGEQLRMDADYRFDAANGYKLPKTFEGLTITVSQAENEYRYYEFKGKMDLSELDKWWQDVSQNGIKGGELGLFNIGDLPPAQINSFVSKYGEPKFEVHVRLPGNTPVDANSRWINREEYMSGKTDILKYVWTPGMPTRIDLMVSRRLEPHKEVSPELVEEHLNQLLDMYQTQIPNGYRPTSYIPPIPYFYQTSTGPTYLDGWIYNQFVAWRDNETYICSGYQTLVIAFLDGIRTSPDENTRALLDGLDYGPIQSWGGNHMAVAIFPSGTDWRSTATVLDPWFNQKPETYSITEWNLLNFLHPYRASGQPSAPEPLDEGRGYPHLNGQPSSYPADEDLTRQLAVPSQHPVLIINSPVTVMVQLEDGRQAGVMPDYRIVNDAVGEISFFAFSKETAGEYTWMFVLPEVAFTVTAYGQQAGTMHVMLLSEQGPQGYGPQTIQQMDGAAFSVDRAGSLSTMTFQSGDSVQPFIITEEILGEAMGIDAPSASEVEEKSEAVQPAEDSPSSSETDVSGISAIFNLIVWIFCLSCLCLTPVFAIVFVIAFRRRKKT